MFDRKRLIMVNYISKMSVIYLIYYNFATEKKHHNIVAILGLMKFYALIHYLRTKDKRQLLTFDGRRDDAFRK